MDKGNRVVVVGAGINGLVAANYLARAGFEVTVIERKDHPGGACTAATCEVNGIQYEYPQGASVFGFMQDFVFKETGLSQRVTIHVPEHPEILFSGTSDEQGLLWISPERQQEMAAALWGEKGDLVGFLGDMAKVTSFLQKGYREAKVPTLRSAAEALGEEMTARWITGSAKSLLNHYLTSEQMKIYYGVSVIESGPVSFDSPYSAFSIPLMFSGGVLEGEWAYVLGGIWQIPLELNKLNDEVGVKTIFSAQVTSLRPDGTLMFEHHDEEKSLSADYFLFATDPVTAARIAGEQALLKKLEGEQLVGTSGKLVLFFKKPARWKYDTGLKDFDSAFRWIIPPKTLNEFQRLSNDVVEKETDFTPGLFEIYCEGAGDRELGGTRDYDLVSVFFKNLAFKKHGGDLPEVKEKALKFILSKIENPEDLFHSILETPRDLADWFFFPGGNIDDVELAEGQTFFQRTYSPDPEESFYQFGSNPRVFYCAAGAYPCGSAAGTPGYMCAKQLIEKSKN